MDQPLVHGEIVFEPTPSNLSGAKIYVRLEDTSLADAPSRVVSERVLTDLSARLTEKDSIPFVLYGQQPDPRASYSVSVHVDVRGRGKVSPGDYINTESCPVLTFGYPDRVTLRVRQVKDQS